MMVHDSDDDRMPRRKRYVDPCPVWFGGGPHCWPFRSVGDPEEVCEGCGITRRAARIRAKLLRLPHGHVTVTKTPAKKWTKLRLVVNNR